MNPRGLDVRIDVLRGEVTDDVRPLDAGGLHRRLMHHRARRARDAGTDEAFVSPLFNAKSLFSGEFSFGGRG